MEENEKKLRLAIRKMMAEMHNVSENDLLVRAGVNWSEAKPNFLEKVNDLISKIDDDQYDDADDLIGSVITSLRIWRSKIKKGKNDIVNKSHPSETIDEELNELMELFGGGQSASDNYDDFRQIKIHLISMLQSGVDTEKLKKQILSLFDIYELRKLRKNNNISDNLSNNVA